MEITKRDGRLEAFDPRKIERAIQKSLDSTGKDYPEGLAASLAGKIASELDKNKAWSVEEIQDRAEEALMASGQFQAARNYILFRSERTARRNERTRILDHFSDKTLASVLSGIQKDFPEDPYSLSILADKFISFSKENMSEAEKYEAITRAAVELTRPEAPKWEFIASRFLLFSFHKDLAVRLSEKNISILHPKACMVITF